jgi:thymidine kinase
MPFGNLEITTGPMKSGKSLTLLKRLTEFYDGCNGRCLLVNSDLDIRSEEAFSTHCSSKFILSKDISSIKVNKLMILNIDNYDYICVDECQFFDDLEEAVVNWLKKGKDVHCCGLIADTELKPFGSLSKLFVYATDVNFLKATCVDCAYGKTATFTKWTSKKK